MIGFLHGVALGIVWLGAVVYLVKLLNFVREKVRR